MNDEASRKAEEFHKLQVVIARVLVALYNQIQQAESDKVPSGWRGYYINVVQPQPIVGRNPSRGEAMITNDGPSDLFISDTPIQIESLLQQYNGLSGQTLNATVIKSGAEPVRIATRGAIHACPVNYGGANANCVINIVETVFDYNQNLAAQSIPSLSDDPDNLVWSSSWDKFSRA